MDKENDLVVITGHIGSGRRTFGQFIRDNFAKAHNCDVGYYAIPCETTTLPRYWGDILTDYRENVFPQLTAMQSSLLLVAVEPGQGVRDIIEYFADHEYTTTLIALGTTTTHVAEERLWQQGDKIAVKEIEESRQACLKQTPDALTLTRNAFIYNTNDTASGMYPELVASRVSDSTFSLYVSKDEIANHPYMNSIITDLDSQKLIISEPALSIHRAAKGSLRLH